MKKSRFTHKEQLEMGSLCYLRACSDLIQFLDCENDGFTYSAGRNHNTLYISIEKL